MTHLYSAMSGKVRKGGFRYPGLIESAFCIGDLTVEVIADGCHLPVEILEMVYRLKGPEKVALTCDSMRCAGQNVKESVLGSLKNGQRVIIEDDVAKMPDRTAFAGSIATDDRLVRVMYHLSLIHILNKMGLIDSWLSLVLMNTTFNLAFIVLMLKATFDGVPKEVVEAAKIDGCSPFMVMTRIFLPVSSTGIAVAVIFAFTRTWNEFLFAFTFISTTEKKPIIVSLYEILKNNPAVGIPWHYVMAGAMYTTVPLVILFICIRNYITGDHTAGAIK